MIQSSTLLSKQRKEVDRTWRALITNDLITGFWLAFFINAGIMTGQIGRHFFSLWFAWVTLVSPDTFWTFNPNVNFGKERVEGGGTKGERKRQIFLHAQSCAASTPCAEHTSVPWAYKCTIPIYIMPHTIRLNSSLCLVLVCSFIQVKLPTEVMTTDKKMHLICSNQTQQSTMFSQCSSVWQNP